MAAPDLPPEPDFITFLFSPKPKFDCYFIVGEKSLVTPVRFGAVKMMLMAHSVVFRTELEDSKLKEEGDIAVKDVYPDTFKTLLKYIYGYDTTGDLTFDEADNMFYAAEKYMMSNLKKKLALRLITLLTPDNVCSLLNNPACYSQLELNASITQIIRYETDKVLASPQFLDVCPSGFVSILEQDGLAVPEIELWRAAIKWAKHRAGSEDGKVLRQQMSEVSKHLRVCTVSTDQFCQEVVSAEILNKDEVALVCRSIGKKVKLDDLTKFSNDIEPRKRLKKSVKLYRRQGVALRSTQEKRELKLTNHCDTSYGGYTYKFTILTKECAIELLPLKCMADARAKMDPEGWTYKVDLTVTITKFINRSTTDPPVNVTFSGQVEYGKTFEIPLAVEGSNVALLPNSKYEFVIRGGYIRFYKASKIEVYEDHNMLLEVQSYKIGYFAPISCFYYRLVVEEED